MAEETVVAKAPLRRIEWRFGGRRGPAQADGRRGELGQYVDAPDAFVAWLRQVHTNAAVMARYDAVWCYVDGDLLFKTAMTTEEVSGQVAESLSAGEKELAVLGRAIAERTEQAHALRLELERIRAEIVDANGRRNAATMELEETRRRCQAEQARIESSVDRERSYLDDLRRQNLDLRMQLLQQWHAEQRELAESVERSRKQHLEEMERSAADVARAAQAHASIAETNQRVLVTAMERHAQSVDSTVKSDAAVADMVAARRLQDVGNNLELAEVLRPLIEAKKNENRPPTSGEIISTSIAEVIKNVDGNKVVDLLGTLVKKLGKEEG